MIIDIISLIIIENVLLHLLPTSTTTTTTPYYPW